MLTELGISCLVVFSHDRLDLTGDVFTLWMPLCSSLLLYMLEEYYFTESITEREAFIDKPEN